MPKLREGSEYMIKEKYGGPMLYLQVTDFEIYQCGSF
jgi:hypothetical protein